MMFSKWIPKTRFAMKKCKHNQTEAAKYLGLLISPSSAANLFAAIRLAGTLESGYIVTVFPDNAFKYLKDRFWSEHDYHIADPFH